jgi:hypothetical protein
MLPTVVEVGVLRGWMPPPPCPPKDEAVGVRPFRVFKVVAVAKLAVRTTAATKDTFRTLVRVV